MGREALESDESVKKRTQWKVKDIVKTSFKTIHGKISTNGFYIQGKQKSHLQNWSFSTPKKQFV